MPDLRLAKLPDRTPVKITFKASPELRRALEEYAAVYNAAYEGAAETVEDLIPFMLTAFMDADPGFKKARRELNGAAAAFDKSRPPNTPAAQPRRHSQED